jgi:hypothetical protein
MTFALPWLRIQSDRNPSSDGHEQVLLRQGLLMINIVLAFRPENRDPAVVAFAPGACSVVENSQQD